MKYSYRFKLNQNDMWLYYMVDRYSTFAGFVQLVFIVSMALLIAAKWDELGNILLPLSVLALSLFTIVQPLAFFAKAGKAINPNTPETLIDFTEDEMIITVQSHVQHIKYKDIVQVISKPLLLIIQPDQKHIYILTKRILGQTKKELYKFLKTNIPS